MVWSSRSRSPPNRLWPAESKEGMGHSSSEKYTLPDLTNTLLEFEKYSLHHQSHPIIGCGQQRPKRVASMKPHHWLSQRSQMRTWLGFSSSAPLFWELFWKSCFQNVSSAGHQTCIIQRWIQSRWSSKIFANFAGDQILLLTAQSPTV